MSLKPHMISPSGRWPVSQMLDSPPRSECRGDECVQDNSPHSGCGLALSRLADSRGRLGDLVGLLERRLCRVVSETAPICAEEVPPSGFQSELARQIDDEATYLGNIASDLDHLIQRLDI